MFGKKDNFEFLAKILSDGSMRESMLGVKRDGPITPEKQRDQAHANASQVILHAQSASYSVWAKAAWDDFLVSLNLVMDPNTDRQKVEFLIGGMRKTLDLLRISYEAMSFKVDASQQEAKQKQFSRKI